MHAGTYPRPTSPGPVPACPGRPARDRRAPTGGLVQKAGQHVADNGRIISIGSSTTVLPSIGVGPPQARG